MPRTKKNLTPEEQLQKVTKEITETEALLEELKEQKERLESQVREKEMSQLYDIIQKSGKSMEEVQSMLLAREE